MPPQSTANRIHINGDIAIMELSRKTGGSVETFFDIADVPKVKAIYYRWHASYEKRLQCFYVVAPGSQKGQRDTVRLARLVTDCPSNCVPDHINHNTLDNRKVNLRIVSQAVNLQNKNGAYRNSKSGIRGVYFHKLTGKWYADVSLNGRHVFQQLCETFEDACQIVSKARSGIYET